MERANWTFEEQWSQSLGNAEVTPPDRVWVAIDGSLANEQAIGYKKQADFYRWIAAACLFLITLGGALFWMNGNVSVQSEMAQNEGFNNSKTSTDGNENSIASSLILDEKKEEISGSDKSIEDVSTTLSKSSSDELKSLMPADEESLSSPATETKKLKSRNNYNSVKFNALTSKPASLATINEPWKAEHLYGIARTWEVIDPAKTTSPLWAGVSFSAGAFDPGFGNGSDMVNVQEEGFSGQIAEQIQSVSPSYSSGQSVAGGLNVGKKFTNRLVVSSGLHYSSFNTGSATSQVVSDQQNNTYALTSETSDRQLENALSSGNLRYEGEQVQLANEYQYLTIPIKAGYVLLDSKFNITLNTGLSSNILVDSKLVSDSDTQNLNNDFNTSENYENIYFNFLTSIEFGYVFRKHYQFLLEPNYNQAITDFTNSNHSENGKPKNLGLSVGFRYNF
ncbi:MAG: hypothetical protein ABJH98_05520 [Reichenbachiella sp.]|uniref:hypothetical protein n=1 Tax=Reichenbachiella sp. TaxID=2184521 RepID=UPI003299434B